MISSAVIIPDESQLQPAAPDQTSFSSLKRRQSSVSGSEESSKRPRLERKSSAISSDNGPPSPDFPRAATTATATGKAMSPPRRRPIVNNDEKSRNRRLFGALLGNLAQPAPRKSSTTATANSLTTASRREEIESRQRQRLQRESEEISKQARRKKEELDRTRRVEQRRWDEQGIKTRHANMRAMAGFLRTETEPRLYYKPWEMRPDEEKTIKRQKEEVEESISKEWDEWERKVHEAKVNDAHAGISGSTPTRQNGDVVEQDTDMAGVSNDSRTDSRDPPINGSVADTESLQQKEREGEEERQPSPSSMRDDERSATASPARSRTEGNRFNQSGSSRPQSSRDDDHGGEELEQGQEDDVIY